MVPFIPIVVDQDFCHCGAMKNNPPKKCCSPEYQCWKVDGNLGAFQQYKCVKIGDPDPIYVPPITNPRRKSWLPSVYSEWIDFPETSSLTEMWDWGIGGSLQNPVPFPVGTATPEAILSRGSFQSFTPPRCLRAKWQCLADDRQETEIGMEIQRMQGPPAPPIGCVCDDFVGPPVPTLCRRMAKECALCKLLKLANCPQDLFDAYGCTDELDCWKKIFEAWTLKIGSIKMIIIGWNWAEDSYLNVKEHWYSLDGALEIMIGTCIIYDDLTGLIPVGVNVGKFNQQFYPYLWGQYPGETGPCPPNRIDTDRVIQEIIHELDNQETTKPLAEGLTEYLQGLTGEERIRFELWLLEWLLGPTGPRL